MLVIWMIWKLFCDDSVYYIVVTDRPGSLTTQSQLTWVLIAHTCIASAPSSTRLYTHTPHLTPVSSLVHSKWILYATSTYVDILSFLVYLPPVFLSSMCFFPSLRCVSLDCLIEVFAVIHSPSGASTISCKEKTLITFLIYAMNFSIELPTYLPFLHLPLLPQ